MIKCKKIQHILLKQKDPQLFTYLEALKIEPQLYALYVAATLFDRSLMLALDQLSGCVDSHAMLIR